MVVDLFDDASAPIFVLAVAIFASQVRLSDLYISHQDPSCTWNCDEVLSVFVTVTVVVSHTLLLVTDDIHTHDGHVGHVGQVFPVGHCDHVGHVGPVFHCGHCGQSGHIKRLADWVFSLFPSSESSTITLSDDTEAVHFTGRFWASISAILCRDYT